MIHVATSTELAKLRADAQWAKLHAVIHKYTPIFKCRINQTFTSYDNVVQIQYDGITYGAYTSVLAGMTMFVGTAEGLHDVGICRVRKAPTASILYIGITSEIEFADNQYITVVDDFNIWSRHWQVINETTVLMDYDIPYSDQNTNMNPVVVMGSDWVLSYEGSNLTIQPSASESWVIGSTIASYSWTAGGASSTADMNTATPTIQYNAPGQYRISCQVTAANGKVSTGYRYVYVMGTGNLPYDIILNSCVLSQDSTGGIFSIVTHEDIDESLLIDCTKIIIYSDDYYNNVKGSIGQESGRENILCIGWLDAQTLDVNPENGELSFTANSLLFWLNTIEAYGAGYIQTDDTPEDWRYAQNLTVDKVIFNILYWRSTVANITDIFISNDTRVSAGIIAPLGTVYSQLLYACDKIFAKPVCDRYGKIYCTVYSQYLSDTDKTSVPVVMDITAQDWQYSTNGIVINKRLHNDVSIVELSGTGDTETELYASRAPGNAFTNFGRHESKPNMMINDQSQCNMLAGLHYAVLNNKYKSVNVELSSFNKLLDIAPNQFISITLAATDTPNGEIWNEKLFVIKRIQYAVSIETGSVTTALECDAVVYEVLSVTLPIELPATPTIPIIEFPGFEEQDWAAWTPGKWQPICIPPNPIPIGSGCPVDAESNGPYNWTINQWMTGVNNYDIFIPANFVVRSVSHSNKTTWAITASWYKWLNSRWEEVSENTQYQIRLYDSDKNIIATGNKDAVTDLKYRTGTFEPASIAEVAYIGIELTADLLRPSTVTHTMEATHPWDTPHHGQLFWGPYGAGIWANTLGGYVEGTAGGESINNILIGTWSQYVDKSFTVEMQQTYGIMTSSNLIRQISGATGQHRAGALAWTKLWEESFTPAFISPVITKRNFIVTPGGSITPLQISASMVHTGYVAGAPAHRCYVDNSIIVMPFATYAMSLKSVQLWNVCPRPA